MIVAIPDMISNSYFPVAAAVELGFFAREGLDMKLELIFPVDRAMREMRDGKVDFVGGSAHSTTSAFPGWKGAKILAAQAQNTYWFLVLRSNLAARRGDIDAIKGLTIGAAPMVDLGLRQLLVESSVDVARDNVNIVPVPMQFLDATKNFGVAAAKALQAGAIDGFWANGMGAEVAIRSGAGTLVIDARRRDGPPKALHYTMSALMTSQRLIDEKPDAAAAAIRALVHTQKALKADPSVATQVGRKLFPPEEAELIAELVRRDGPFYDARVTREFVAGMTEFQRNVGLLDGHVAYEDVVATQFSDLWSA